MMVLPRMIQMKRNKDSNEEAATIMCPYLSERGGIYRGKANNQ